MKRPRRLTPNLARAVEAAARMSALTALVLHWDDCDARQQRADQEAAWLFDFLKSVQGNRPVGSALNAGDFRLLLEGICRKTLADLESK